MISDIPRDKLTFEAFKKKYLNVMPGNHDFDEDLISFRLRIINRSQEDMLLHRTDVNKCQSEQVRSLKK